MMRSRKITFSSMFIALLWTVLLLAFTSDHLIAETAFESKRKTVFGIYPPKIKAFGAPGSIVTETLNVSNGTKSSQTFSIRKIGYLTTKAGLERRPLTSLESWNLARNIQFPNISGDSFVVPAKSSKEIKVQITVPNQLEGSHYAGLAVSRGPGHAPDQTTIQTLEEKTADVERSKEYSSEVGVSIGTSLVIRVVLTVLSDKLRYGFKLREVTILPASGNKPTTFAAKLENTGNAELDSMLMMLLLDQRKVVARMRSYDRYIAMPGIIRTIEFQPTFRTIDLERGKEYKVIVSTSKKGLSIPPQQGTVKLK